MAHVGFPWGWYCGISTHPFDDEGVLLLVLGIKARSNVV